ncbi:hypothetical protein EPO34_01720 [Patescibacteria group bacterium]|nr:MAG: hypothetical protein EPO34_01720 [Patescibacteria group bacterium]
MRCQIGSFSAGKAIGMCGIIVFAAFASLFANVHDVSAVTCSSGAAAQNGITVVPSHGNVFYIDTGVTPVLDAGYIGYRVTNGTGSSQSSLWAQVSSFTGSNVSLANALDSAMQLPTLADGSTGTSYFMLKATGATMSAQGHTLKVYDDRPDLAGATVLYECDFSFSKVQETIKAASNKLADNGLTSAAAIEVSDTSPELGQLVTITVEGQTGQIGAGSTPDFDIIWLAPAAVSTWPTRALRLESVSITFDGNANWANTADQVTYANQLLITGANGLTNVDNSEYRISYGFRVVGRPTSTVTAVPIAQIASGTQVKHSDTGAAGGTLDISFASLTINAALTKSVTTTTGLTVVDCTGACAVPGESGSGETYVEVPYRLTASSTTATTLTVDEFVDQAPTGPIFIPGSATVTDIGRTGVAIGDPVTVTADAAPKPLHFTGPFTLNSGTTASIDYEMWVPVGSFANTAYAKIGDFLVGATASAMSRITVTSTGTSTVGVVADTADFSISAVTDPATSITASAATLNGTVDPNGTAVLTGQFEYGTSPTLVGATTTTATTPASGTLDGLTDPTAVSLGLTGLSSGTTYYYRVKAGSAQGTILSFTTLAVLADPTPTTTAATSVAATTATVNGTINPNLTPITGIQFVYGTVSDLSSGTTTVTVDDGTGTAALTAGGSSTQPFSYAVTGLTSGITYYFKIRACTSALTGTYPNVSCTTAFEGSILNFTTSLASRTLTIDAGSYVASYTLTDTPPTITSTASAGAGTKTYTSTTTGVCTIGSTTGIVTFVAAGTCTIDADIASDGTYDTADATDISFSVTLAARTLTIDAGSYVASYSMTDTPPTITSTASAGTGTKTYTSTTTGVCTIGSTTGIVTFVAAGTCTIDADIDADGTYDTADATDISFSVTLAARTLTIDAGSYVSSYSLTDTPPTITSTASAGTGTKSYTSTTTGVCTIGSTTGIVTFVAAGTCTIDADIDADGTYDAADATDISFSVTLAARTLTIDAGSYVASYELTDTPPTITSTASAGAGTKTYTSTTTGVCTIGSTTGIVTFVSAGTCTIDADIDADGTYDTADATDISFSVTLAARTLTIDAGSYESSYLITEAEPTITSTASAGAGTKTYTSTTTGVCTIGSTTGIVTFVAAGTCTIDADIDADGTYAAADATDISFSITRRSGGGSIVVNPPSNPGSDTGTTTSPEPSAPETTSELPPPSPVTEPVPSQPAPPDVDFSAASYDIYIVNPDGTERHMTDPRYARVERVSDTVDIIRFEDKGSDFDFDDVVIRVDYSDWTRIVVTVLAVDAGWLHNVRIALSNAGALVSDLLIWPDSHLGIGQYALIDANEDGAYVVGAILPIVEDVEEPYVDPAGVLPPLPPTTDVEPPPSVPAADALPAPCEVACDEVGYDLYIVNPDGTERHMGTPYVRVTPAADGRTIVGFEDSGRDFDYNDVRVLVDTRDCSAVTFELLELDAAWHHRLALQVSLRGEPKLDRVVWNDTHEAAGSIRTINAKDDPAMCVEARAPEPVASACVLSSPFTSNLGPGNVGDAVVRLQEILRCLKHFPEDVSASGTYGPITQRAVAAFQALKNIPPIGLVGPLTRAALNAFVRSAPAASGQ